MKIYKSSEVVWFPTDCDGCEYLERYDINIDDYTNICKINNMQIDDCDVGFQWHRCPKGYLNGEFENKNSTGGNINENDNREHDEN